MSIKPISRKSVGSEVMDQLKEQILSGAWQPGSKIPGEMELTRSLGVSRLSVREAIQRLVGMGILTARRGEGTFVTEMLPKEYFNVLLPMLMLEEVNLLDMLEFRSILEIQSVRLAALRATPEDIEGLISIYQRMEQTQTDQERFAVEDLNFHTAIALSTHNQIIIKVNSIIHDMLKTAMLKIVHTFGTQGGLYYHSKILQAISEHDSQKASAYMQEHLDETLKKTNELQKDERSKFNDTIHSRA